MRETFGTILKTTQNYCIDDETSSSNSLSDSRTFLKREINKSVQYIQRKLNMYKTRGTPKTMSTVADQIYYHYPPGLNNIVSATMDIGDRHYPMEILSNQMVWDRYQEVEILANRILQYVFPRQYDFGIYPTPGDVYTVTLVGNYLPQRMSAEDYNDGTVSVSQNSQTVTGSGTTFTSNMVGRWFCEANSDGDAIGNWYKISAFGSTTSLTLQSFFEESSLSASNYVIGESPEIPEEAQEFIPYKAAASYYATVRKDPEQAQKLLNYFFTGDFANPRRSGKLEGGILDIVSRYKNEGRGASPLIRMHKGQYDGRNPFDERWSTTLTSA